MDTNNIFFAGKTALSIIRHIRRRSDLRLAPTSIREVTALPGSYVRLSRLGIPQLCSLLDAREGNELHILVPTRESRRRSHGIRCEVRSVPRGEHPYMQLTSADKRYPSPLLPSNGRIFVESIPSVVVTLAAELCAHERAGRISHQQAVLKLLKLCQELCGTYVHDPFHPLAGEVVYERSPVLTFEELECFVNGLKHVRGVRLVREVLPHVFERSGSPQESFLGPAMFCEPALGGHELGTYKANVSLDLSPAQRRVITCKQITPDFQMEQYLTAMEYNGKVHEDGIMPEKDRVRMLDYQTLGWHAFVFTNRDVRTPSAFNSSIRRILAIIEQYEGPSAVRAFEKRVADPEFLARQKVLFEVYRPWLS